MAKVLRTFSLLFLRKNRYFITFFFRNGKLIVDDLVIMV